MPGKAEENKALNEALENLRVTLTGTRPRAPDTIANYLSVANQFLTWLGDRVPPSALDIHRYFAHRREQGLSENSLRTHFAVITKLCQANDWKFPLTARDRPEEPEETRERAFTTEEIATLVKNRDKYSDGERFYLAIATIYLPRRIEHARITKRDIKENTLRIQTAKKGEKRTHLIPDDILPYIHTYHPRQKARSTMSWMFQQICEKGLGQKKPGYGWHSFRYPGTTLLMSALAKADKDITLVGYFLRWSRREFGQRFAGTRIAGVYVRPELLSSDPFFIDREVFQVHPFLPFWRSPPGG